MSEQTTFEEIAKVIEQNQSFLVISHMNPDGDAIGSTIALGSVLEKLGKTVYMRNQDGVPRSLEFLPGCEAVKTPESEPLEVDVVFALDCATQPRLGDGSLALGAKAKLTVVIDHHKTNTCYGDLNYIDAGSPATGQILYQLFQSQGYEITDVARDNIYVAVSTDTGSFRYRGTTSATYQMAADLVDRGLDISDINEATYERSPLRRVQLLGELLNTLTVSPCGRIADWRLLQDVKDKLELLPDDSEEMINHIRAIEGVVIAISFEDVPGDNVRVSLRSKSDDYDVSEIAQVFGGGGHARAAGIRMEAPISEAREKLLAEVNKVING